MTSFDGKSRFDQVATATYGLAINLSLKQMLRIRVGAGVTIPHVIPYPSFLWQNWLKWVFHDIIIDNVTARDWEQL